MLHVAGAPSVMVIVEHLKSSECRMRAITPFEIGTRVECAVTVYGAPTVPIQGTIATREQRGPRYIYTVSVQSAPGQIEAIATLNATAQARARSGDVQTASALTRSSVRVPVNFELRYSLSGGMPRPARATNISTGGILMNCSDALKVGTALDLEIPLDAERIKISGRIVAHQASSPNYNIAFFEVKEETREKIARFVEPRVKA
jgi:hypothetical protein